MSADEITWNAARTEARLGQVRATVLRNPATPSRVLRLTGLQPPVTEVNTTAASDAEAIALAERLLPIAHTDGGEAVLRALAD